MLIAAWEAETGRSLSVQFKANLVYIVDPVLNQTTKTKTLSLQFGQIATRWQIAWWQVKEKLCRFRCTICAVSHRTQNFYKESLKKKVLLK